MKCLSESVEHGVIVLGPGDLPSVIHEPTCALSGHWVFRIQSEMTPCEAERLYAGIAGFLDVPRGCGSLQVPAPELRPWRGDLTWFGTADPMCCVFYLFFLSFSALSRLRFFAIILLRPSRADDQTNQIDEK